MIPKFRAWLNIEERYGGQEMCEVKGWDEEGEVMLYNAGDYRWDEVILMQYTGLKDKNGVEIYEGDVTKLGEGGAYHICVVEFNNDELCYQLTNRKTIGEYIGELLFVRGKYMAECEVIGTLYENPELLEAHT